MKYPSAHVFLPGPVQKQDSLVVNGMASGEARVGGRVRNGHAQHRSAMLRCLHLPSLLLWHSNFESAPHAIENRPLSACRLSVSTTKVTKERKGIHMSLHLL